MSGREQRWENLGSSPRARGTFDVIVVGLGVVGGAVCAELSRRGAKVLGIDQFAIPHALGSSHGDSRMIRLAYYEHPDYVPLLREAYRGWEALEEACGERVLFKIGGLYMGRLEAPGELVPESLRAAREHGLEHELLDRDEVRRRYPMFELPEDYGALFEPEAGFLLPERILPAQIRLALAAGATIRGEEKVVEILLHGEKEVEVETRFGQYRAGHVVLAGGPWSAELLGSIRKYPGFEPEPRLDLGLRATRQTLAWVWPDDPEPFRMENLPVWAVESEKVGQPRDPERDPRGPQLRDDPGGLWYGFPILGDLTTRPGMKVANHFPGREVDPYHHRSPKTLDAEVLLPHIERYVPSAVGTLLSLDLCLYTLSPDSHFVVDRHPRYPERVSFACGLSGHGFKFAPVLGRVLADWALAGSTELPVGFLGVERLGNVWKKPDDGFGEEQAAEAAAESDETDVRT